jgi:hypothetical protein
MLEVGAGVARGGVVFEPEPAPPEHAASKNATARASTRDRNGSETQGSRAILTDANVDVRIRRRFTNGDRSLFRPSKKERAATRILIQF